MGKRSVGLLFILCAVLLSTLVGCIPFGDPLANQFQSVTINDNRDNIGINTSDQLIFKGKIYFTLDRNLYMLDGDRNLHQLTRHIDVRDPAVSPDGKWIAFIIRYQNWSDLAYMPAAGGRWKVLRSGKGTYVKSAGPYAPYSTAFWYAQPCWSADSTHLLFLSDWAKRYVDPGVPSYLLDMQIFSIALADPTAMPQEVAYATYGDGGLRDPAYRPGHPDQIVYTDYRYDVSGTKQLIQLYLEDPDAIANHPGKYRPGASNIEYDPAVALTPALSDVANLEPVFSPNGNTLLYVRREDGTHMSLYTMPIAESVTATPNNPITAQQALVPYNHASRLISGTLLSQPIWSPDGQQIAYIDYQNSTFNIWLLNVVDNSQTAVYRVKDTPIQLTDAGGHLDADSRPCWTP